MPEQDNQSAAKPEDIEAFSPHVLHVADTDAFARFGRMFRQLGLALSNEGIDVSLLTDDPDAADDLDGTPVIDCLYPSFRGLYAWRLESYLQRTFARLPTVVHLWGTTCLRTISRWTGALGIPLILHLTTSQEVEELERRGVGEHEHALTICGEFADRLAARWATLDDSVEVVPPAILAPSESREFGPRADRTIGIVWAGRVDADSGLELLIDAAQQLNGAGLDFQAAIIGDGPAADQIWRRAGANGVEQQVSMTGGAKIWDHALAGADILVVPVCQQRISLAPLLAMGSGTLVIASDDQLADWFVEGETALLFAAGDADALAGAIRKAAEANPSVSGISRAARDFVQQNHAVTDTAIRLAEMYRDLAKPVVS